MIHVLDFNGNIIDFISNDDSSIIRAEYTRDSKSELLDITILSKRAEHFKKRNRVIIQDKNGMYREFIIERNEEEGQYVNVECNASYLYDISSAKPILSGKFTDTTVNEKLLEVLKDSGWVVGDCDFGGIKDMVWDSPKTPFELINEIEKLHNLKANYEIVINGNEIVERKVNMNEPIPLFKGKEIVYGKDLVSMKRIIDFSEVKTALLVLGPENDKGKRISTVVTDDEAQEQFNLPQRYIWGIYEPEVDSNKATLSKIASMGEIELNKHKSASVKYEINVANIEKEYPHEVVRYGDLVRIKNSDFTPSLYAESEVIGFTHDLISGDCTYTFGRIVEYREDDLFKYFRSKLDYFNHKLNDNITNVNTIVQDTLDTELQYFEKKIIKSDTPPENAVNDVFWLDTSNPNVPILKRYWEGQWIKASVDNAEDIGGITREKALFSELSNTFINLTIQHSKLLNEMHEVMNSEYLVDEDIKVSLNSNLDKTIAVFDSIKANLESMTPDTATIGKLIDTQALFLKYREQLQALYKVVEQAKISIDERLKLLQSQYTDEKFNEALSEVADKFGLQVSEDNQLIGEIDVTHQVIKAVAEHTDEMFANYVKAEDYTTDKEGIVQRLNNADTERKQLSNQIADRVSLTTYNYDKFSNEQKLQTMKTEVIQDGRRIAQTVSNETFNAKAKTLNRVLSQYINDTTTGHQFTYDENGNISNFTVGPSGIKLNARVIDINDGDVVIQNGVTTIQDAYIPKLFSKQATINYLDAIGITARTLQAKDKQSTVNIESGSMTFSKTDGNKLDLNNDGLRSYNPDGTLRFRIDNTFVMSGALGTPNENVYLASTREVRAVHYASIPGDGYVTSYQYTPVRASQFYGNRLSVNHGTPGVNNLYLSTLAGGEVRITHFDTTDTFRPLRASEVFAYRISNNAENTSNQNLYLSPSGGAEVIVTAPNSTNDYRTLRARSITLHGGDAIRSNVAGNFYIGVGGYELLVTNNNFGNNGNPSYRPVRASAFTPGSYYQYKEDITKWDYDVLSVIKSDFQAYQYKLINDENRKLRRGVVVGGGYETITEFIDKDGVDLYEMTTWGLRGVQQLAQENDEIKNDNEILKNIVIEMNNRLKILEDKLDEQKS